MLCLDKTCIYQWQEEIQNKLILEPWLPNSTLELEKQKIHGDTSFEKKNQSNAKLLNYNLKKS